MDETATSSHEAIFYDLMDDLEAVRSGPWKLHFSKRGVEIDELYDLDASPGVSTNLYARHPEIIAQLQKLAEWARPSLGDARLGREGKDVRPGGRVDDAQQLTTFDPDHPYYLAEYDLPDRG